MYTIWNTKKKLKASLKYWFLSNDLKALKFCCDCNDCGRLFQILADALEKARSPSVFFRWSWIIFRLDTGTRAEVVRRSLLDGDHAFKITGGVSMNALETEHSNLEIDSKLYRQPVRTYKWRCDVLMSWQWAHQSVCRVLHRLELAKVGSGNTIQ